MVSINAWRNAVKVAKQLKAQEAAAEEAERRRKELEEQVPELTAAERKVGEWEDADVYRMF